MVTSVLSPQPAHDTDDVEVMKDLEQRGVQGLDSLSLEELQLLTERKRRQLQLEAEEKKARRLQARSRAAGLSGHAQHGS